MCVNVAQNNAKERGLFGGGGVDERIENIARTVDTRCPDPVGAFLLIIFPEKPPHRAPDAGQIYARARAEPWCCRPGKRRSIARQEC